MRLAKKKNSNTTVTHSFCNRLQCSLKHTHSISETENPSLLTGKGSGELKSFPVMLWTFTEELCTIQTVCSISSSAKHNQRYPNFRWWTFANINFNKKKKYRRKRSLKNIYIYEIPYLLFWGAAKLHHKACKKKKEDVMSAISTESKNSSWK